MNRREVLKVGAVAAATAASGATETGCATVPHAPAPPDDHAAHAFLGQLDRSLELAKHVRPVDRMYAAVRPGPRSDETQALVDKHDGMFRDMLRTLYITQSFRDQTIETQTHPDVQTRMHSHLGEIDSTVFAVSELLAAQTPDQRAKLRDHVRKNPRTAMDLAEVLDQHAALAGASKERRRQLRNMMSQVTFRLKHDAPGALIDEYTAKVERLRAQDGRSALSLALAEKLGEQEFWRYQQRLAQSDQASPTAPPATTPPPPGAPPPATPPPPGAPPPTTAPPPGAPPPMQPQPGPPGQIAPQPQPATSPQPVEAPQPGRKAMTVGAYMLGIGVVDFGLGALIVSTVSESSVLFGIGLVGGITIGALLFAVGLIVLLVGVIIAAVN